MRDWRKKIEPALEAEEARRLCVCVRACVCVCEREEKCLHTQIEPALEAVIEGNERERERTCIHAHTRTHTHHTSVINTKFWSTRRAVCLLLIHMYTAPYTHTHTLMPHAHTWHY